MEVHDKIKFLRLSKNLTQGYLADQLNMEVANYSRLERGDTSISLNRLEKVAEILEISVVRFFDNHHEDVDKNELESLQHQIAGILNELKQINHKLDNIK